jgi:predicted metal-dependent phosphoesterase TrpH
MSKSHHEDKIKEILPDAANKYAEAVDDAQHEAQKKCRAAWRNYLEGLKVALEQPKIQEAARAYAEAYTEAVQKSLAHQNSQRYLEAVRQYATAAQEAQEGLQTRSKEAYMTLVADVQEALAHVARTYRTQFESYVKDLQEAFSQADASHIDAVTLARMGSATLAAAALRLHLV